MSQHPFRDGKNPYGSSNSWTSGGRPSAPSPIQPTSPYSSTPPQQLQYQQQYGRGSQLTPNYPHPGMLQPMSPVFMSTPLSPGMSPVFGCPSPGYLHCPRPRWPSPISPNMTARPFIPTQSQTQNPLNISNHQTCGPAEYLIAPYRSGEYEYVGVPLDPSRAPDDEDSGPSTAEIIASQSQDYIDEKLAEYQATIHQLQGKCIYVTR